MAVAAVRRGWLLLFIVRIAVSMAGIVKRNQLNKVVGVLAAGNNVANVQKTSSLPVAWAIHITIFVDVATVMKTV